MKHYNIAIVGATTVVEETLLSILAERNFPVKNLKLVTLKIPSFENNIFNGIEVKTETLTKDSFKNIDFAIFLSCAAVSNEFVPFAVESGAIVIDSSSAYREIPEIPLIVPEVNPLAIKDHKGIISNPDSTTIIMMLALKPLYDFAKINRVIATSYQAVSGADSTGLCKSYLKNRDWSSKLTPKVELFQHQTLHNIIPQIDAFGENGYTEEEMTMIGETQKILCDKKIKVSLTCVKVPVATAHSISVTVETQKKITLSKARELFEQANGLVLFDVPSETKSPIPLLDAGKDNCYVGHIREDISAKNSISFFISGDHIRKGTALNIIQIMELLITKQLS